MAHDFYIRLMRTLGTRIDAVPEDFVTECLAAALREDEELVDQFVALLQGRSAAAVTSQASWRVFTQQSFGSSRPDLVLLASDGARIAVEIKLDAPEGDGQLLKYADVPDVGGIAFLTPEPRTIDPTVRAHPCYLPGSADCGHFLWPEVYQLVARRAAALDRPPLTHAALLGLLDARGLSMLDPGREDRARWKKQLGLWLASAQVGVAKRGFKFDGKFDGRAGQISTKVRDTGQVRRVWIELVSSPKFGWMKLYFESVAEQQAAFSRLSTHSSTGATLGGYTLRRSTSRNGPGWIVEARLPLRPALADSDPSARLAEWVLNTIDVADSSPSTAHDGSPTNG